MKKVEKLVRRDALKLMGLGGMGLLSSSQKIEAKTTLSVPSSHKKARIIIAGGGTGGMIAAARLRRSAPNAQIIMIAPNDKHFYQPGQLLVAAGIEDTPSNNIQKTIDLLPNNVTWLQESIIGFDPKNNAVKTDKSGTVAYDILIIALGSEYDYSRIAGLDTSMIGTEGISSIYLNDTINGDAKGGFLTNISLNAMHYEAAKKPLHVLFTEPDTPIKAEGTSLSMMMLSHHFLQSKGATHPINFTYAKAGDTLFSMPSFAKKLEKKITQHKVIIPLFSHNLKAVDPGKKVATFAHGEKKVQLSYDFIHITPPLQAPTVLRNSPLAIREGKLKGWMHVDAKTLSHPTFKNVFGIGDILGLPHIKSGGAAAHQGIILQDNIASVLENKPLPLTYDGYSVAPIMIEYGKCMMAEFNHQGASPTLPLDPYASRRLWWFWQTSLMRPLYFNLLMRGMM